MKTKHILITASIALILIVLMSVSYVSAYQLLCLTHGQKLPPPPVKSYYTCDHDTCQVCVTSHYYPTNIGLCWNLPNCNTYNPGNDTAPIIDTKPPVLTVSSPVDNAKYNSKYVLFNLTTDETSTLYYTDNVKGNGVYSRLASLVKSYLKTISFTDGLQNITIKAEDAKGNEYMLTKSFWVDSTKPKITKTLPGKGFANGKFEIWFTEANPISVTLDYGNFITGRRTANVPVSSCTALDGKGKYYCSVNVSLNDYNNQNIDYKFKVTDVVGNYIESKPVTLKVDSEKPVINNPSSFWSQGVGANSKYIYFNISITEINFDKVTYIDNSLTRPSWKSLCTSLKNGICAKKVTFSKGTHNVDVKVSDDAGNELIQSIGNFDVDY